MTSYDEYFRELFAAYVDLRADGLLDRTGGAISLRTHDGNIVISSTGTCRRGWIPENTNVTVITPEGGRLTKNLPFAASGAPIHLALYSLCSDIGAIVHTHSPYALSFASLGLGAPNTINLADVLGDVPCLLSPDRDIKNSVLEGKGVPSVPSGIVQRPDVYAVNMLLVSQLKNLFEHRCDEVTKHPLGFLLQRHGGFTFGSKLQYALDAMYRIESSCRTAILSTLAKTFTDSPL